MPEAQFQNLCFVISDIDFKDETLSMDQYQNFIYDIDMQRNLFEQQIKTLKLLNVGKSHPNCVSFIQRNQRRRAGGSNKNFNFKLLVLLNWEDKQQE